MKERQGNESTENIHGDVLLFVVDVASTQRTTLRTQRTALRTQRTQRNTTQGCMHCNTSLREGSLLFPSRLPADTLGMMR